MKHILKISKQPLLVVLLIGSLGLSAQTLDRAKLDAYFDTLEARDMYMGMVAVSKDGSLIYTKTIGSADLLNNQKANTQSKYRIGSISKIYTAVLVMQQVEEGKLRLDQKLSEFFPSVTHADSITIRQLLQHRSGIHNFTDDSLYMTYHTQAQTREQMLERISQYPSDFVPGERFGYSNSNYVLLTYILEDVAAQSYDDLVHAYISQKLKLQNTYVGGKIEVKNNECLSYVYDTQWRQQDQTDMSVPEGAGSIVSNAAELISFIEALMSGGLVSDESLTQMMSLEDNYGLGLMSFPFYDLKGYGHTGGIDGFSSLVVHFPDSNLSFAFTSNGANMNTNDVSLTVLKAATGRAIEIPTAPEVYEIIPSELGQYVGTYHSDQLSADFIIEEKEGALYAQLSSQPPVPVTPTAKDIFAYSMVKAELHFDPVQNTLTLIQGGKEFVFYKKISR